MSATRLALPFADNMITSRPIMATQVMSSFYYHPVVYSSLVVCQMQHAYHSNMRIHGNNDLYPSPKRINVECQALLAFGDSEDVQP